MVDSIDQNQEQGESPSDSLIRVIEHFYQCEARMFSPLNNSTIPRPTEEEKPLPLNSYRQAVTSLGLGELLTPDYLEREITFIEKASPKALMARYPAGHRICLNLMPYLQEGVPAGNLFFFVLSPLGLSLGPSGDYAYYFLNFPVEIQQQCTFQVPFFRQLNLPSAGEREQIKAGLTTAWNNIKTLLNI